MKNLNSDQLRKRLAKHTRKMNWLAEQNDLIVGLLAERGLQAIEKTADKELVFFADKMILTNAAGDEVFNTDRPNPFVNYKPKKEIALTACELKAGGWWCEGTGLSEERLLSYNGLEIHAPGWDGKYHFCFIRSGRVYRGLPGELSRVTHGLKQIHRLGNYFYWGV